MKTVSPRRLTRSMTTPIAKRLRPRQSRVSRTPASKSPNHQRKQNTTWQSSTSKPNKDWYNHPTISNANPNKDSCNQPTISNATVVLSTDVQPTPINVLVDSRSTHSYPPAPLSESSIFSDWLLNHPSCNRNDPPIPLEVIRRLDYRLRDSA